MTCAGCGRANPTGARFCGGCGTSLAPRCPACGAESEADARFCVACGSPLGSRATDVAGERKVVSIVFADLAGSTALHERLDAESTRAFMDRYYRAMQGAVEAHGGSVTQLLGDGVKAVFGAPRVAEDDALRAVRAAVEMQRAFRELVADPSAAVGEVGLRVAVNTGEVVAKDETEIIGDPVNVAARLQQEARDGDVLIGESTQRLVGQLLTLAPFGTFMLKGRAEPVSAYRVVSLERPAGAPAIAFVGREDELGRLMALYDAAIRSSGARLAVILGSPGLGKSRLLAELGHRLGERATLLLARCDATGGATFAPIAEALREQLGVDVGADRDSVRAAIEAALPGDPGERTRIAEGVAALLAGMPESPEETFFVVRRLLAGLAREHPVVLAIDDLQWAEPLLLDLTEHLVQWSSDVPLLVLAAARPELREARSSLATPGGLVADVITLGGLDAAAATRLAASVIGADALPAAIAGRVLATSEGNPLFVGELVRMLVQDGALRREGDRWTTAVELSALEMPPTIHALLAARIERLRPEERTVLERAAVIGRQFSRTAVAHLLPGEITDLDARLEALRRSELVERDTGWLLGEPVLRFHHVLIRDAAYRRLLKHTRAELHERFADWLEGRVGEGVEHDEAIGWQLEQAHRHLCELGPPDERGRALGERAARRLAAAGRRALAHDDLPLAASLLGRALERLDPADPARADLALDWCEALLAAGEVATASAAIDELGRFSGGSDRLRAWHTCFAGELAALTDPKALRATAEAVEAAAEALASAGDAAGEAKAHSVHALALSRLGQVGACEAALDRALAAARRARDRRRSNAVLAGAPLAALWGPGPVARASGRCLDVVRVLRITQGAPAVEAVALRCQAVLEALRGRSEAARRMIASSRRMVEELGLTQGLLETEYFAGLIEWIEGDSAAAEQSLRAAYEGLRSHGLGIDAARAAALLGRPLLAQGRAAEAEALSHESEALAGDDLQAAITWRRVRAEALARRGEHASAVELARAAVEIAAATDALLHHADARMALAAALGAAGRSDEADAEEARAIELWEAKGATLLAERARRGVAQVTPVERAPDARAEPQPERRRVRPNAVTAALDRLTAALAAGDADAASALFSDSVEHVHHPSGTSYGSDGMRATFKRFLRSRDPKYRNEPLATLGESLGLCRWCISGFGTGEGRFDVGAYEREEIVIGEVDERGQIRRSETFATDRLGDAVARLYERYAELLPEGAERDRAAAAARSVGAVLSQGTDLDRLASAWAPSIEVVDHRIVGIGSLCGAQELRAAISTLFELASDLSTRIDDVLGLRSDALLVRWTNLEAERAGDGTFERHFLWLGVIGTDGLLSRWEVFDADRDAEAVARFDELAAEPQAVRPVRRRLQPNAATAQAARFDSALAERDADALALLLAEDAEVVDHTTGASYGRPGELDHYRKMLRTEALAHRQEPLATLGDSLALCRQSTSGRGAAGRTFDVGAFQIDKITLNEVDAQGRRRRHEVFAADHLGDAVARLYERYAELLPEGPERDRATATARSVAALPGPPDCWPFAPDVEAIDQRTVGWGSLHGAEAVVRSIRALIQLSEDFINRIDDVLGLRPDALLVRWINSGTDRASGGVFERDLCELFVFGEDGLVARWEQFDADREAEAIARFDELAAGPPAVRPMRRRVRPNAATASNARLEVAIASRDADALSALVADRCEVIDHITGVTYDREGMLVTMRAPLRAREATVRLEPLATLGDQLVLARSSFSAGGYAGVTMDVGAYERETISLAQVDAQGRRTRSEVFAAGHLGDAIIRLYECYAELLPAGAGRARAASTARSVAALLGPLDCDRWATALAPAIEFFDHRTLGLGRARGVDACLRSLRSLLEVVGETATRVDDIGDLQAGALLVRQTNFGTDRAGGGAFERSFLLLLVFGDDGLLTHLQQFDADRPDAARARLDELTALPPVPRPVRRRVRPNAATASEALLEAAIAARDADAIAAHVAELHEVLDHQRAASYDREGSLATWRGLLRARDGTYRPEPLATLGDSLALCRQWVSGSGVTGERWDVGAYEMENIVLAEVDARGGRRRSEIFAAGRLGDAIARLYERYAELLLDGPERARAAATARSVAAMLGASFDPDRYATAFAPAVQSVDHRTLGTFSALGADTLLLGLRSWFDLVADVIMRADEILGLQPDALLLRWNFSGTDRAGGGALERPFIWLLVFGSDGLLVRYEQFDAERDAEALARFDELTAGPPRTIPRRVRPNAAMGLVARIDAAVAARDAELIPTLFADRVEHLHHPTGSSYNREGVLFSLRSLLSARGPRLRHEPLAILGDSLALSSFSVSASGLSGGRFDVGPYQRDEIELMEVDPQGRGRRAEFFAAERLGDAIVRLYERYAELLPEGPARTRAEATARSGAAVLGAFDPERFATALAPAVEARDHRTLATESAHGAAALLEVVRTWLDVAEETSIRCDDVLGLESDASLTRLTFSGTDRSGGGAFERPFIGLAAFGADGLLTRIELFETDRETEALARFDELTAEPPARLRRVRPNAATRNEAQIGAAIAARDMDALANLYADPAETVHHPTGVTYGRDGILTSVGDGLANVEGFAYRAEPMASLGESLALVYLQISSAGSHSYGLDIGPTERVYHSLIEVDARGRRRRTDLFASDRLGDVIARLYERYAELLPDGPERARAAATARSVAARMDPDRGAAMFAPGIECVDHRILGTWSAHGAEAVLQNLRSVRDLSHDHGARDDDLLALRSDSFLVSRSTFGTARAGGGAFERPYIGLFAFGADGLVSRWELFDVGRDAEALARFDELAAGPLEPRLANAAWRCVERVWRLRRARDWEGFRACLGPGCVMDDRRPYVQLRLSVEQVLASERILAESPGVELQHELLATRGERLVLLRIEVAGGTADGGPFEVVHLAVLEVDGDGCALAIVLFDLDALDTAWAELEARYAAGEAAAHARVAAAMAAFFRAIDARDWDAMPALLAPDLVVTDHRPLGWETLHGPATYLESLRSLVELAPDVRLRRDHLSFSDRAALVGDTWLGTREGGAFEAPRAVVFELDVSGRIRSLDLYNPEQLDEARVRFAAIRPGSGAVPSDPLAALAKPNAASAALDRLQAAFEARDWAAVRRLGAEGARFDDRRRHALVSYGVDGWMAELKLGAWGDGEIQRRLVATAGDRICVERVLWAGGPAGGRVEIEYLWLAEVDESGRLVSGVMFDPEDQRAASRDALSRWLARDAAAAAVMGPSFEFAEGVNDHDRARARAVLADDLVVHDHRLVGQGRVDGADAYLDSLAVLWDLAPDIQIDSTFALALERHGAVAVGRGFGTLPGGGAFENYLITVAIVAHGRMTRMELFEPEAVESALARLAELRPDPLRIPPNAATRAAERWVEAIVAGDRESLNAVLAPGLVFDDRRRQVLITGDRELLLSSTRLIGTAQPRVSRTVLATAGERLALQHILVAGSSGGGAFEVEFLEILEVDGDGRLIAVIEFDPDDRRAASAEMLERRARSDAAQSLPPAAIEMLRAFRDHDLARCRRAVPDDFVFDDRRRTGPGPLAGADAYIAFLATLFQESPDALYEPLYDVCVGGQGVLLVARIFGTLSDGGEFEMAHVNLGRIEAGRLVGAEVFELDDLDLARARFEELGATAAVSQ